MALTHSLLKFDWNPESGIALQLIHHCNAKTDRWMNRCKWMHGPLRCMYDQNVNGYHTGYSAFKMALGTMEEWQKNNNNNNNSDHVIVCWRSQS